MAEILHFEPNVPVQLALAYPGGRPIQRDRRAFAHSIMYSLTDGRVMFLDIDVAARIERRGIQARQPFFICKYRSGKGALAQWRVWLPGEVGEQPDGTFGWPREPWPASPTDSVQTVPSPIAPNRLGAEPRKHHTPCRAQRATAERNSR